MVRNHIGLLLFLLSMNNAWAQSGLEDTLVISAEDYAPPSSETVVGRLDGLAPPLGYPGREVVDVAFVVDIEGKEFSEFVNPDVFQLSDLKNINFICIGKGGAALEETCDYYEKDVRREAPNAQLERQVLHHDAIEREHQAAPAAAVIDDGLREEKIRFGLALVRGVSAMAMYTATVVLVGHQDPLAIIPLALIVPLWTGTQLYLSTDQLAWQNSPGLFRIDRKARGNPIMFHAKRLAVSTAYFTMLGTLGYLNYTNPGFFSVESAVSVSLSAGLSWLMGGFWDKANVNLLNNRFAANPENRQRIERDSRVLSLVTSTFITMANFLILSGADPTISAVVVGSVSALGFTAVVATAERDSIEAGIRSLVLDALFAVKQSCRTLAARIGGLF